MWESRDVEEAAGGGGAEGRLSKNRTGQRATIQPPFSLPIFIFQSHCVGGVRKEGEAGNPGLASLTEELSWLNLCSDSFVWFPWKLTKGTW